MRILDESRQKYKRKFISEGVCIFCSRNEVLDCSGLKSEYWQVFANKFPYMDGNVMIVPIRHIERIADINKKEWTDFGKILTKTQNVLGNIFKAESFNIGLNTGIDSGASIPHLHWQVIPRRFKNISTKNTFDDLYSVAVSGKETVKMIEKYLKKEAKKK